MKQDNLTRHGVGLIYGLIVLYVFGMAANIFVTFPQSGNAAAMWKFAWTQPPLSIHMIIVGLVFLSSIAFLVRAIIVRHTKWLYPAIIGFIGLLVGVISGSIFISTQNAWSSYTMSLGFILALIAYGTGAVRTSVHKPENAKSSS